MPDAVVAMLVAMLGGAAVGVERQWSGHASGPEARFAGIRTFAMLGLIGGLAGRLWWSGAAALGTVVLAAAALLVAVAYLAASRREIDATTEVAAIVVLGAGAMAGLGHLQAASAVVAATALLLFEKSRLHDLVAHVHPAELASAFRFAVMAIVVLPLLPQGPFGPLGGVRPRELWLLVLFFSAISFVGYLARRVVGASRGYPVAGLLGGLVSSTSVTLSFARLSRDRHDLGVALAQGVIAANTAIYVRVLAASALLSPALALALTPSLAAPFAIGVLVLVARGFRASPAAPDLDEARNPLQLRAALEMVAVFQGVLLIVHLVGRVGPSSVLAAAAVLGLNDVDALTVSMAKGVGSGDIATALAVRAITIGLVANTCVKLALSAGIGRGPFRGLAASVLLAMAATLVGALTLR